MTDDEFLTAFEDCSLPLEHFGHRGHVRAAYLYAERFLLEEAINKMRDGIRAYNKVHKGPESLMRGYHETITQAFMRLVYAARLRGDGYASSEEFFAAHREIMTKSALRPYYSDDQLWTMEAKREFAPPDRAPLPRFLSKDRVIAHAIIPREIRAAKELMREYAASLDFDLCFQDFDRELMMLPGDYAAPRGRLLVGWAGAEPVGCIALRPLENNIGEVKRLWVRTAERGKGWGRRLANAVMEEASRAGYAALRLDTIAEMTEAIQLYQSLGFQEIEPYRHNPIDGAVYMEAKVVVPQTSD